MNDPSEPTHVVVEWDEAQIEAMLAGQYAIARAIKELTKATKDAADAAWKLVPERIDA